MDMMTLAMAKSYTDKMTLPVVELSEETCAALFSENIANLTEAEVAAFTKAKENTTPVVVKVDWNGMKMATVADLATNAIGVIFYAADTHVVGTIAFSFTDSGMTAQIGS